MKRRRFTRSVLSMVTVVFALLAVPCWPLLASPATIRAAPRSVVPSELVPGHAQQMLMAAACNDKESDEECEEEPEQPDVCMRLSGTSGRVESTSTITYTLAAHNSGRGEAASLNVRLSFTPGLAAPQDVTFNPPGGWVSGVLSDAIELRFRPLSAGQVATATVRLTVLPTVVAGTTLAGRARLLENSRQPDRLSNRLTLALGQPGAGLPGPLGLDPAEGVAGTMFRASYDGFASYEKLSVWYHRPDGSSVALGSLWANEQGGITFPVASANLPAGRYLVVAQGQCSQSAAVGAMIVVGPSNAD